jgi:hypothetical protein
MLARGLRNAPAAACVAVEKIHFDDAHFQRDIRNEGVSLH